MLRYRSVSHFSITHLVLKNYTIIIYVSPVPQAPSIVQFERTTPTEIILRWAPDSSDDVTTFITNYTVKCYPLKLSSGQRAGQNVLIESNTTKMEMLITGLSPVFRYVLSVAASTKKGEGSFSNETIVECE